MKTKYYKFDVILHFSESLYEIRYTVSKTSAEGSWALDGRVERKATIEAITEAVAHAQLVDSSGRHVTVIDAASRMTYPARQAFQFFTDRWIPRAHQSDVLVNIRRLLRYEMKFEGESLYLFHSPLIHV